MENNDIEQPEGKEEEKIEVIAEEGTEEAFPEIPIVEAFQGLKDKYFRLYAEFENYKKRMAKEKEGLLKYAAESLIYDLLPSIDNLEIALRHSDSDLSQGLQEGVGITLRELLRTLEKFGLKPIESIGKPFDPEFHHAMMQVEQDDIEDNTVVEELRRGFIFGDKVLRAALVTVSKKPQKSDTAENNIEEEREE